MGGLGSRCRRSAHEAAEARTITRPQPISTASCETKPSTETLRQRGIRPKYPKYNETPLLTIGKEVRILKEYGFRRALVECVNDSEGTVDVAYEDGDKEDETVPADIVRPLEGYDEQLCSTEDGDSSDSVEKQRQLGVRPNAPAYSDTPLLSVGKLVRVQKGESCRRAIIQCVDEGDGTVDVALQAAAGIWAGATVDAKKKKASEESVPVSVVRPLEEFECRSQAVWKRAFAEDFFGAVTSLKEGADDLFIDVKDYDAAAEYYTIAIDKLRDVRPSELDKVIIPHGDQLVLVKVKEVDVKTQQAFVTFEQQDSGKPQVIAAPLGTVVPWHEGHLALQGSLYMNRARIAMHIERGQEAARDLSLVIAIWDRSKSSSARRVQLPKAHCLRAKISFSRGEIELAKADISAALAGDPPKTTADVVWQLYRDVEQHIKDKKNSKSAKDKTAKDRTAKDACIIKDLGKFAGAFPID